MHLVDWHATLLHLAHATPTSCMAHNFLRLGGPGRSKPWCKMIFVHDFELLFPSAEILLATPELGR